MFTGGVLHCELSFCIVIPSTQRILDQINGDHWALGYLPDQGSSFQITKVVWAARSINTVSGLKSLPIKNDCV